MQKTKMIFTIGPASDNEETLTQFIKIGMNVARLNFSHGTHETHKEKIDLIKKIRTNLNTPTAIMLDIKGPKIRTHNFINDGVELKANQIFTFKCGTEITGNTQECSISYSELYKDVNIGGTILVDDGLINFEIIDIKGKDIICKVLNDGVIKNHKGVNVPNVSINLPSVTEKDKDDLVFGCKMGVDFVAASFIRKASDIKEIRDLLNKNNGKNIQIIAKIESQEGVNNIDSILEVADGIMVARGDMGVEIPIEKVPIIQKKIIKKCNEAGKIVITATQMLDSMIRNSLPTRAEACDICNAIFDGTDAIMLSGESANGSWPVEAVQAMATIATESEKLLNYELAESKAKNHIPAISGVISRAACNAANELNASAIISVTQTGATARRISQSRPQCPVVAVTPCEKVARKLALSFGVYPVVVKSMNSHKEIMEDSVNYAKEAGFVNAGETVVIAAGIPADKAGSTNVLKVSEVK